MATENRLASFAEASEADQQRDHYRVTIDLAGALLSNPNATRRHGVVLNDLSVGGVHVTSAKEFKLGKHLSILFDIGVCGEPQEVRAHGLVVRASCDDAETFLLGIRFTYLASEAVHRLGRYVMQQQLSEIARADREAPGLRTTSRVG